MSCFTHPIHVPVDIALAVFRVMHDDQQGDEWDLLDSRPRDVILTWVREILIMNHVKDVEREMLWWQRELCDEKQN